MKEAKHYQKLANNLAACGLCNHFCRIENGRRGLCGVRLNCDGVLYTLVYDKVVAANIDPIEKKPLYHFLPGSKTFSIATVGCNFHCDNCQNADISQLPKDSNWSTKDLPGSALTPAEIVESALMSGCQSIAYTYTEPTIFFELALDCMKLARSKGLKNVWVSNGYTSTPALIQARDYLDAVNVDLKFFNRQSYLKIAGAKLEPILENLKWYKTNGVWLEVTTLIIPSLNDNPQELNNIAEFISGELGQNVPWHISVFHPAFKLLDHPATSRDIINLAWDIGQQAGLNYIYVGNIEDQNRSNTYCPGCKSLIVQRTGYLVKRFDEDGQCPKCHAKIDLIL
ncbi:MAG: AmmeMemoRadiSam system radical SAM enzyme [Patescibacteria group bacterium]|jgi:pyruvate formate lyase activating enzyme|nr:AmmeMemoRadiSam system radical SAM enzyme [Patescibacteria group bacterium]